MSEVTHILSALEQGDPSAAEQLLPLVYDELRKLAAARLAAEPAGQTLQPTALVHEAYLRLVGGEEPAWDSRGHFFAAAAEAMRRIVVETARRKKRLPPAAHAADPQHRGRPASAPRPARGGQHDAGTRLRPRAEPPLRPGRLAEPPARGKDDDLPHLRLHERADPTFHRVGRAGAVGRIGNPSCTACATPVASNGVIGLAIGVSRTIGGVIVVIGA